MDWTLVVILQVMFQPSLSVLFTVEAEQSMYTSEFGGDVVMGCRFQPKLSNPDANLKVTWHRIIPNFDREVYWLENGKEKLVSQHPDYRGRVQLLTQELKDGWAKLEISRLRINDSGTYQCSVLTEEGADYKTITMSVIAPYKAVTKSIQKAAEGDEVLLTCQSEGYPNSPVTWKDANQKSISSNTTATSTPDQLVKVTSEIRVRSADKNNYTCNFTKDGYSATFHIPDELLPPHVKNDALIVVLSIGVILAVIGIAVVMYRRRKGFYKNSNRNLLLDDRDRPVPTAACLQVNKENEEEKIILKEGCAEESLEASVKAHYSDMRQHWDAFIVDELPHRLQNNKGQPVNLQALLPEAGETLLLEGPPGSGKTTVAHILVSSWTEGPTPALSDLLDLSTLRLLIYVDCSKVKEDLFQEITTQLSVTEKISAEDELRTVLTRSSEALLLLDGYREGNQVFDESLRRFLSERGGCRVLVMACPGHCPTLRDTVGTGGVLELQAQVVKY